MANNFTFYSPTEIVFGRGTHTETARYVQKYHGSKVLVVYGSERVVQSGLLESVVAPMREAGLGCHLLGGVVPNPHLGKVYEGIELGKREGVDFLLAVGGGSVIDTAKAIAYGLAEPDRSLRPGQAVSVYIKSILPDKMKIKLVVVNKELNQPLRFEPHYFVTRGRIRRWTYSTPQSRKQIETVFA